VFEFERMPLIDWQYKILYYQNFLIKFINLLRKTALKIKIGGRSVILGEKIAIENCFNKYINIFLTKLNFMSVF
jgi:hypothetical protein